MSRGNTLLLKNRGESKAKNGYLFFAATGCGFFFRLQLLLVVEFLRAAELGFRISARHFGADVLLGLDEIDSILRTVIVSVFGSSVPTTFTFRPAHCSAKTCASSL
jgi:hypothetical protein